MSEPIKHNRSGLKNPRKARIGETIGGGVTMNRFTPFLPTGSLPALRDIAMPRMPVSTQRRIEFILLAIIAVALPLAIVPQVRP